jgi:type IV pilus assembly protein PilM
MDLKDQMSQASGPPEQLKKSPGNYLKILWDAFKKSSFIWGPQINDIGLSVGHRNIVALELDKSQEIPRIVRFAVREITSENPNISAIIREMFESEGFTNSYVNTSISGKSIIIRFIRFPKMTKKELRTSLEYEAEKYIPFDVSQVYLDFDLIETDEKNKFVEVVLVAAKKEGINDVLTSCKAAGLTVKLIDVDSFACLNTFVTAYPEEKTKTVALLNIGAKITNLLVMSNGVPAFSRDVYFGGDDITLGLSKKMHIDVHAAAQLKYNFKGTDDTDVKLIIREILGYLLTEMKLSFDYYQNQDQKKKAQIEAVYLIGGTSRLEGIDVLLQDSIGVPVTILDPLRCVTVAENIDHELLNNYCASLAVPIGLALRDQ